MLVIGHSWVWHFQRPNQARSELEKEGWRFEFVGWLGADLDYLIQNVNRAMRQEHTHVLIFGQLTEIYREYPHKQGNSNIGDIPWLLVPNLKYKAEKHAQKLDKFVRVCQRINPAVQVLVVIPPPADLLKYNRINPANIDSFLQFYGDNNEDHNRVECENRIYHDALQVHQELKRLLNQQISWNTKCVFDLTEVIQELAERDKFLSQFLGGTRNTLSDRLTEVWDNGDGVHPGQIFLDLAWRKLQRNIHFMTCRPEHCSANSLESYSSRSSLNFSHITTGLPNMRGTSINWPFHSSSFPQPYFNNFRGPLESGPFLPPINLSHLTTGFLHRRGASINWPFPAPLFPQSYIDNFRGLESDLLPFNFSHLTTDLLYGERTSINRPFLNSFVFPQPYIDSLRSLPLYQPIVPRSSLVKQLEWKTVKMTYVEQLSQNMDKFKKITIQDSSYKTILTDFKALETSMAARVGEITGNSEICGNNISTTRDIITEISDNADETVEVETKLSSTGDGVRNKRDTKVSMQTSDSVSASGREREGLIVSPFTPEQLELIRSKSLHLLSELCTLIDGPANSQQIARAVVEILTL